MSSAELSEWLAFYYIEPFGHEADNIRIAKPMSDLINATCGAKTTAKDYMYNFTGALDFEADRVANQDKIEAMLDGVFGTLERRGDS